MGIGPYGERLNDLRERYSARLERLERDVALQAAEVATLKGEVVSLRGSFGKHIDVAVDEARRAGDRQEAVLAAVADLKSEVRVLKEQRGTVSIGVLAQVAGVLGGLCAVVAIIISIADKASG